MIFSILWSSFIVLYGITITMKEAYTKFIKWYGTKENNNRYIIFGYCPSHMVKTAAEDSRETGAACEINLCTVRAQTILFWIDSARMVEKLYSDEIQKEQLFQPFMLAWYFTLRITTLIPHLQHNPLWIWYFNFE